MIFVNDRHITIPDEDVIITAHKTICFKVNSTDDKQNYILFIKKSDTTVIKLNLNKTIQRDHTILEWYVLPKHLDNSNVISIQLKIETNENSAYFTNEDYLVVGDEIDISNATNADYQRGYSDGYSKGLADGKAGNYDTGYETGKQDGINEGYNNGYEQGKADGYKQGYDEGYSKGYSEGYEKGKAEGGGGYSNDLIRKFVERDLYGNQFTEFTIPYGTTKLGHSAFKACVYLKTLNIPDTVVSIGESALSLCHVLQTELPDGVTYIGTAAFQSSSGQIIPRLPTELKTIKKQAFQYCSAPFTLSEIPIKVETIEAQAFQNCKGFTELTFKGTPTSIATNSFQGCTNLLNIYVPWAEGEVANAPWGATNATIHYNSEV